jgi:hypothetical protein
MYEPFEAQIKEWLKEDPALAAVSVLQRLTKIDPPRFKGKDLRMVQRLVKAWHMEMTGLTILDGGWMKSWPGSPSAAAEGDPGHVDATALDNIIQ